MRKLWMHQKGFLNYYGSPSAYLDPGEYRYGKVLKREIRRFGLVKFRKGKTNALIVGKSKQEGRKIIRQVPLLRFKIKNTEAEEGT